MRTFFAAASILALSATGAMASNPVTVTLTATVAPYIAVTNTTDSSLTVTDPFGGSAVPGNNNRNAEFSGKSTFEVDANVDFDIVLDWPTWQVGGAGYNQAAYAGADCKIGGTITFDTNPAPNSNNTATPPGGTSGWDVTSHSAFPASAFTAGLDRVFAIGIEASPDVNDCPNGLVPPDNYTLPVNITVTAS